ncbi:hypothetical protein BGW80DRAFT_1457476 [Lactifluus volemus]|nr:hypothetical protein BGW80DRAFT_1457476 [Lactifluus volemus]
MNLDSISAVHLDTNHSFRSSKEMLLSSTERAAFVTAARLLSCLVTESLVRAIFIPLPWSDGVGFAVVLNAPISNIPSLDSKYYSEGDILAINRLERLSMETDLDYSTHLICFQGCFMTSQDSDLDEHWERSSQALHFDRSLLTVALELASVVHVMPDSDTACHCSAIMRECHENGSEARGERLIVCTTLVERGHAGTDGITPSVVRAFGLNTEDKRIKWLDDFVRLFFAAFLPPILEDGVAFEAHPQNTIARFSLAAPHELRGYRVTLNIHPGNSVATNTLDDVYTRMYHTMFHNHLQQLVRVLGLHYNGKGWEVIRVRYGSRSRLVML